MLVVVSPIVRLDPADFRQAVSDYLLDPSVSFSAQNETGDNLTAARISQQCEEYILDKAAALGMQIETKVILNEDTFYPLPVKVMISGQYSPWQKEQLTVIIAQDLGIPEEQQEWEYR